MLSVRASGWVTAVLGSLPLPSTQGPLTACAAVEGQPGLEAWLLVVLVPWDRGQGSFPLQLQFPCYVKRVVL